LVEAAPPEAFEMERDRDDQIVAAGIGAAIGEEPAKCRSQCGVWSVLEPVQDLGQPGIVVFRAAIPGACTRAEEPRSLR
jgi:hypothetical protein